MDKVELRKLIREEILLIFEENEKSSKKGEKLFRVQDNIGKAKYTISFHDGSKTHKDGSSFWDIKVLSSKKERDSFVKDLISKGYKEE